MPLTPFHPVVREWFVETLGEPTRPQREGWPLIRTGGHTLIAAPTGSGKTLAAFLWAIDELLRRGPDLEEATQVLYVSPLKALGNDVQKNLEAPLAELRRRDPSLPELRVLVRSGDTPPAARTAMRRRPPHILVTTPETLYILLTSDGGRAMLRTVRTVIVDEIHAIAGDKRGAHLALSLERLEALAERPPQRIGLSATQKPLAQVGRLLVGAGRECALVDAGHLREIDLEIEIPGSPLDAVCSHETWQEIYTRMASLIREHRTTLVFVNTRKLAERVAARLSEILGAGEVTSHHGSLARERRLEAERRLKDGSLRALVATASLELGIDIGDVDLVIQTGVTPSISVLLQRVGRAGHALTRTPKGRIFPLTRDELVTAAASALAIRNGELDRTPEPARALDILSQQIVAACVAETWGEKDLFERLRRAWPYRELPREDFETVVALHTQGRGALLHRDGVGRRLRATRRARITALTSGGAIPDTADYRVLLEPGETLVGTLNEDFAIESNAGDIFQLGNTSWRILKVESGIVRVADAGSAPPTLPFWLGEGPARTRELSEAVGRVRENGRDPSWLENACGLGPAAAGQLAGYLEAGARALGAMPTPRRVVAERFFDEAGGMQLVLHSPFGGRINRAWGLALRKRICRGFGFELQAAANEDAILISLGPQHSFPLDEIFDFLHPATTRDLLIQAILPAPLFMTRWRWNAGRSLLLPRTQQGGRRVPSPLLRMRADDLLARSFPEVVACGETLPPGDIPIPWDHPIVRQTIEDALTEALDAEGLVSILRDLRAGAIEAIAVDTPEPSPLSRGILNAMPYAFLDDAPLEERRAQAVLSRRGLADRAADTVGALDPAAVQRARENAWPQPENAEEVHESLLWMGYVTASEAGGSGWEAWLQELSFARRVGLEGDRWLAAEAPRDPKEMLRGRLEALGPVVLEGEGPEDDLLPVLPASDAAHLAALEREGVVLRCRIAGRPAWCNRRLLARIHRDTIERLRQEIAPVSASIYWRFLAHWQHAAGGTRLEGPRGVLEIVRQLAGFEAPAPAWEGTILPSRVRGYRPDWIDQVTLSGEAVWGRLWGSGSLSARSTPVCLLPRADLETWLALSAMKSAAGSMPAEPAPPPSSHALAVIAALGRGALFTQELERATRLLPSHLEMGLVEAIARGRVTCDSFGGLRRLLKPPHLRRENDRVTRLAPAGRWSVLAAGGEPREREAGPACGWRETGPAALEFTAAVDFTVAVDFTARILLNRYGVVFRRVVEREKIPLPWRDIVRVCRQMELRGEIRGGRFVAGFAGEQYALPSAVESLRRVRRAEAAEIVSVSAADPLNLLGILTPDERVPSLTRRRVTVG